MFKSDKPFHYDVDPDYDFVLEERGNTYTALRKIRWMDKDSFALDLRKYYATEEGEKMAKGVSLMSEEGANELVRVLVSTQYGDDRQLADTICSDRVEVAARIYDKIQNDNELKNQVEDIIVNHLADENDEEYYNLDEVI